MARHVFPLDRLAASVVDQAGTSLRNAAGRVLTVYTDEALTTPADIQTHPAGVDIASSQVTVDAYSRVPRFLGPEDVTVLWATGGVRLVAEDGAAGPGETAGGAAEGASDNLGLTLHKYGRKVLSKGTSGQWDAALVEGGCVFRDPISGRYAMTHVGYDVLGGTAVAKIGLAYSDDLVNWTKHPTPILGPSGTPGAPDVAGCSGGVIVAEVTDEGVTYHLFYIGLTQPGYEGGTKTLCHATASSLTGTWTRHGAIISPSGPGWRSTQIWRGVPVERNGTWFLFFNASGAPNNRERIGYATAPSLSGPWTVDDVNSPLLGAGANDFVGDPTVRRVGDLWVMDYYDLSGPSSTGRDRVATTTDAAFPLGWTTHTAPTLIAGPDAYDALHAHKPFILVDGGTVFHYYTAANVGDTDRGIALATTDPQLVIPTPVTGALNDDSALVNLLGVLASRGIIEDNTVEASSAAEDNFTRANGALVGSTSSGGDVWEGSGSGWNVVSNDAVFTGTSDAFAALNSGLSNNYAVELTISQLTGTFPLTIVPRYAGSTTTGVVIFRQEAGQWKLKVDNVVNATILSDGATPLTAGDVVRVEVSGTTYTLKRNGTVRGSWTGISAHSAVTKQGVGGNGSANQPLALSGFAVYPL